MHKKLTILRRLFSTQCLHPFRVNHKKRILNSLLSSAILSLFPIKTIIMIMSNIQLTILITFIFPSTKHPFKSKRLCNYNNKVLASSLTKSGSKLKGIHLNQLLTKIIAINQIIYQITILHLIKNKTVQMKKKKGTSLFQINQITI